MEIPIRTLITHNKLLQQQKLQSQALHNLKKSSSSASHSNGIDSMITVSEGLLTKLESITLEENQQLQYLLSNQLLALIENRFQQDQKPDVYFTYYAKIQTFLQTKKIQKKQQMKLEAVTNPRAFAERKVMDILILIYFFKFFFSLTLFRLKKIV